MVEIKSKMTEEQRYGISPSGSTEELHGGIKGQQDGNEMDEQ